MRAPRARAIAAPVRYPLDQSCTAWKYSASLPLVIQYSPGGAGRRCASFRVAARIQACRIALLEAAREVRRKSLRTVGIRFFPRLIGFSPEPVTLDGLIRAARDLKSDVAREIRQHVTASTK